MEKKSKRRTPERILATALRLFNELGHSNVTPSAIADDLNISPGNLYYHFHSKDEIVNALFAEFEREVEPLLGLQDDRARDVEDVWLYWHLLFERVWKYRFVYRDINDMLMRNRRVEVHFQRILRQMHRVSLVLCQGLQRMGQFNATATQLQVVATNMTVVAAYWLSYEHARNPRHAPDMGRGIYQVISLATPWLEASARQQLEKLSMAYVQ